MMASPAVHTPPPTHFQQCAPPTPYQWIGNPKDWWHPLGILGAKGRH